MALRPLLVAALLAVPGAASASSPVTFGVGLGVIAPTLVAGNGEDLAGPLDAPPAPALRLPVLAGSLRLEPELLFARDRDPAYATKSWLRVGLLAAYGFEVGERSRGYVGPAVAWIRRSADLVVPGLPPVPGHADDVAVTLAAGGELLVGGALGLGIEGRLGVQDVQLLEGARVRNGEAVLTTAHDTVGVGEVIASARVYFR